MSWPSSHDSCHAYLYDLPSGKYFAGTSAGKLDHTSFAARVCSQPQQSRLTYSPGTRSRYAQGIHRRASVTATTNQTRIDKRSRILRGIELFPPHLPKHTVVAVSDFVNPPWLNKLAHFHRSIVPVFMHEGNIVVGPSLDENSQICASCLVGRLWANARDSHAFSTLIESYISERVHIHQTVRVEPDQLIDRAIESATSKVAIEPRSVATFDLYSGVTKLRRISALPGKHEDHQIEVRCIE